MSQITNQFIEYAVKHGEAIEHGDHKIANKYHEELSTLFETIKSNNDWGLLKDMLRHDDESVRLWSATFLLKNDSDNALKVLGQLKKSKKIIGLTASTTIDMWNKGMLQLD